MGSMKPGEGTTASSSGGFAPTSSSPTSLADIEGQKKKIADIKQQIEALQAQLVKEEAALATFEGANEKQKEPAAAAAEAAAQETPAVEQPPSEEQPAATEGEKPAEE